MSAQRAHVEDDPDVRRREAWQDILRLRQEIADANPDMTDEDWDRFADEWAEEVNEGLREIVRRSRRESASHSS